MKTVSINLYSFEELDEKAKERARKWFREGDAFDARYSHTIEDAKQISLALGDWQIDSYDRVTEIDGEFSEGAFVTANLILENHGEQTDTHKLAKEFMAAWDALPETNSEDARSDDADPIEHEFLNKLLIDYGGMMQQEIIHLQSDEYADETITANDYTFLKDGTRFEPEAV